jgi:flagellar capping protein FliD
VGMSVQRDGTMALDTTKLTAALKNYPTQTPGSASAYQLFSFEDAKTMPDGTKLNSSGTAGNTTIAQGNTQAGWQAGWGDGIANRISAFADSMISPSSMYNSPSGGGGRYSGALLNRITSLDTTVKDYGTQITAYNLRLDDYQRFLQSQFTAMESSVSKLRSQGSYFSSGGGSSGGTLSSGG